MNGLISKDMWLLRKSTMGIMLGIIIIYAIDMVRNHFIAPDIVTLFILYQIASLFSVLCDYDDKNKYKLVINSLPVNKRQIVLSRYIAVCINVALFTLLQFIMIEVRQCFGLENYTDIGTNNIFLSFYIDLTCILFCAPIYIKYTSSKGLLVLVMFLCYLISGVNYLLVQTIKQPIFMVAVGCIGFIVSVGLSVKYYEKRDW